MNDEDPSTLSEFWEDLEFGFISTPLGQDSSGVLRPRGSSWETTEGSVDIVQLPTWWEESCGAGRAPASGPTSKNRGHGDRWESWGRARSRLADHTRCSRRILTPGVGPGTDARPPPADRSVHPIVALRSSPGLGSCCSLHAVSPQHLWIWE